MVVILTLTFDSHSLPHSTTINFYVLFHIWDNQIQPPFDPEEPPKLAGPGMVHVFSLSSRGLHQIIPFTGGIIGQSISASFTGN